MHCLRPSLGVGQGVVAKERSTDRHSCKSLYSASSTQIHVHSANARLNIVAWRMGAAESRSLTSTSSDAAIRGRIGFHVLRVADSSPAADGGIEPFFDYVVGVSGQPLDAEMAAKAQGSGGSVEEMLATIVEEHEGRQLSLQVWSSKRAELRDVIVIPSRDWSQTPGAGTSEAGLPDVDAQPSLLGLSLRLCNPDGALEKVWHVLEILENSPAESAGLVPFGDYILGYSGGVLNKEGDFYKLVEEHVDKPLRLFVYNSDFDVTREVVIVPNRAWSTGAGEGLLGCGVGYGVLHRIPKPQARGNLETASSTSSPSPQQKRRRQDNSFHHDQAVTSSLGVSVHPSGAQKVPVRMSATVTPSTPPRAPSPSNYNTNSNSPLGGQPSWKGYTLNDHARLPGNSPNRGNYGLSAPPRSPSAASSHRSSVAEVIAEEDE